MVPIESQQPPSDSRPKRLPHFELLLALVSLLVIQSFMAGETILQRSVMNILFLLVIVSAIRSLSDSRARAVAAISLGVTAFILSFYAELQFSIGLTIAVEFCYIVVFALLLIVLFESVFASGPVDANRIIGAISIYLILGIAWAFLYAVLENVQPDSFSINRDETDSGAGQTLHSELTYFSAVTLTTLGYGDIVPVSRPARMLATIQAMFGQLYVAIIIARLVGLHVSQRE